jgi:hypothetical protein
MILQQLMNKPIPTADPLEEETLGVVIEEAGHRSRGWSHKKAL